MLLFALLLLSIMHPAAALCGIGIAPCGDDAIIACDVGYNCESNPFDDPPFTGCCFEAPTSKPGDDPLHPSNTVPPLNGPVDPGNPVNPVNPLDPSDPNNHNDGITNKPGTRKPLVTHPAVPACHNTIPDAECEHNKKLCTNRYYATLMAQQCAATCGCGGQPHVFLSTARHPEAAATTTTVRATTRHVAPPPAVHTACVDLVNSSTGVSDCTTFSYMCNHKVYFNFMTQQCPRTCGRCQSGR